MTATELFKAGKLRQAVEAQVQAVKADPGANNRLFLFELLAFDGNLERARKQIEAVNYDDMGRDFAVMVYRLLLQAEDARRRLFREGVAPHFLAEPPAHVRLRLAAIDHLRHNRQAEALGLLQEAAAASPVLKGEINGTAFTSLSDTDQVFGPVLEALDRKGHYCWLPLEQLRRLKTEAPRFPRDLVWLPATIETVDGQGGEVHVPVLYPGTHEQDDEQLRLGRLTRWVGPDDGPIRGVGARVLEAGEDEVCLLDVRQLVMG